MTTTTSTKQTEPTASTDSGYTDFSKFGEEVFKQFQNFKTPGFDTEPLMTSHQHNMETLAGLQKMTMETTRTFGQFQSQYTSQAMEELANFTRTMMSAGPRVEDRVESQSRLMKNAVKNMVAQSQELNDIFNKSQQAATKLYNTRLSQCLDEYTAMAKAAAQTTKN